MQDYAKTTELVNAAYNSAGSGQRQFEKTLESLEAKLTKLENAWDAFTMGLSNNVIIKGVVDTLTTLLTAVNGLIDGLSGGQGLIKSVMTLGAVLGGLKLGGSLVDKALASDFVQRKVKLTKGDSETVANVQNGNKDKISYTRKGKEMAKSFSEGFQSFKASDRKGGFFLENVLGIDTKKNQLGKELDKIIEDAIQSVSFNNPDIVADLDWQDKMSQQVQELNYQLYKGDITNEEYSESLQKLGVAIQDTVEFLGRITATQEETQVNAEKLGTSMTAVGGAFMALAGIFSMFGEEGEKIASVLATIGGILVGVGQLLPTLKAGIVSLSATLHMAVPELAIIMGALVAIGALITGFAIAWNNNSPEAKLEKAAQATEKAKEMAEGASQAYDDLLSKKSEFDKLTTSLETLTQGTLEWREALAEANNEVINLQKEFPELEVSVDKATGQLKIDNWSDVLKAQTDRIEATNKQLTMAQINENNAQLAVTKKNISNNNDLTAEQKVSQREVEQLKTETNNRALIGSIISKYQTDKNGDYLGNLGELLTKEVTYNTYKKNDRGEKVISGEKTENVFEKAIKNRANKIINEKSTAEQKKYAEQIFGKDAVDNMEDSEIKDAILNYEKANQIEKLTEKILSYNEEDQKAFQVLQGSFSGKISDWDVSDYLSLSDEQLKRFQEDLNLESADAVKVLLNEGRNQIQDTIDKATENFTNLGFNSNFIDQFSIDNLSNISSQISEMSNESARAYLDAYSEALDGVDEEDRNRLENYLSSIDLSDAVQVLDAKEFMKNLGMDEAQIERFWATANTAVKPYITSLEQVQSLNERISKLGEVRSLVENGEKTFSSSDKESLVSAGFSDSDFLQTGIDEWTYIGKDSNDLLRQIDEKVGQIGETIVGDLQESVEKGKEYKEKIDADEDGSTAKDLQLLAENGYSGVNYNREKLEELATTLGIITEGLSEEGIANKLIDAYNMVANLADNEKAVRKEIVNNASRQYDLTGNFGTFTGDLTEDEQMTIMTAQLNKYNGAMEYYEELKEKAGDTSGKFNLKLADEAVRLFKLQKQYDKTADSIDTYKDALLQGESAGTDYYTALSTAKSDLSTLFDVDKELITDDFVKQHAQDIYNLAEGGEVGTQAFNNLQKALGQLEWKAMEDSLKETLGDCKIDINGILTWIEGLDPSLKVQFLANDSPLVSALKQMVVNCNWAGEQAKIGLGQALAIIEKIAGVKISTDIVTLDPRAGAAGVKYMTDNGYWHLGNGVYLKQSMDFSGSGALDGITGTGFPSRDKDKSDSSKKDSTWENPYDKLYNLTEQINEALRQREKLEREYDHILERRGSTFTELRKNYNSQLQSLQKEIQLQEQLRAGRLAQLKALSSETYKGQDSDGNELIKSFKDWGVTKYASYNTKTGLLNIDWKAIDKIKNENKGGAVEAYISRLEELQGQIEDVDIQIEDFKDKIIELEKEGMQDYLDFEQKVYDAIINRQQKQIDNFQNLSDKIYDSNARILDSLQNSIDLQRQIRDNTQTEEDINEKEARLAYLRRDTSNGNLLEIKQLEKELKDDRQNYEDTLVDQQLEKFTKQNDDAQTARERQIELMQAQLSYASENGNYWSEAYSLITTGFKVDGSLNQASQLWNLLKEDEGWKGMSKFGKTNWQTEIKEGILSAAQGFANWNMYKAKNIDKSLTLGDGTKLTWDGKNWKDKSGKIYKDVDYNSKTGKFISSTSSKSSQKSGSSSSNKISDNKNINSKTTNKTTTTNNTQSSTKKSLGVGDKVRVSPSTTIYSTSYGEGANTQYSLFQKDPIYKILEEAHGYYRVRHHSVSSGSSGWFKKSDVKAYKTGGLADFTGPAWLDGTKSSPELILNARDTENFIALKDVLGSLLKKNNFSNNSQSVGDMYFNIDINVDEIKDDYDVEALSKKIKQELADSAMYRNVNLMNFIR